MERAAAYLDEHRERHLDELKEFLRIPSVSALSEHKQDVVAAAVWLVDYLKRIGFGGARLIETGGHPIVYAERFDAPGAPVALIYGHYDVQPVDPLPLWTSPPFEPDVRDGRLYARGASDDKGQLIMHLQALEALLRTRGRLPVNVKLLIEGEEEIGSPSLDPFVRQSREMLAADAVVISDTSMFAEGMPTICVGLRGIACLEVHVRGARSDLHSGLYGGAAPNAAHLLVELLASMREGQGRILVPGFYDGVEELDPEERAAIQALPFDEAAFAGELGVKELVGEPEYTPLERISTRPTLEINGMWGGFQGEGTKTVIPAEAHAKITCRLVPYQDPEEIQRRIAEHLRRVAPSSAQVEVEFGHVARPWKCSPNHPVIQAGVRALEKSFGRSVALMRMGGSIPVVEAFDAALGAPVVLMGFASPHSNAHAPDEFFPLDTFVVGRRALAAYWDELAKGA